MDAATPEDLRSSGTLLAFKNNPSMLTDLVSLLYQSLTRRETLLDLGVGFGYAAQMLKNTLGFKEAVGVDIDEERLAKSSERGIKTVSLDLDQASTHLPFPDESVDLQSDLPSIERHHGPLDNLGDPFCDVTKIQEVRFDWLLIGEIGGEYAGFLYWHLGEKPFFAPHVENFAHIREVQVLEKFQGQGVGRQLILYALESLKALGTKNVFLATAETNDVARHLYESLGFKQFRKQIHYTLRINSSTKEDLQPR